MAYVNYDRLQLRLITLEIQENLAILEGMTGRAKLNAIQPDLVAISNPLRLTKTTEDYYRE